jgi:hypothetical protein
MASSPLQHCQRYSPVSAVTFYVRNNRDCFNLNGYLLCDYAMLCCAIGALGSENDTEGFELPIRSGGFKTTDCYSVATRFNSPDADWKPGT